ncbi:MAG: hypothetical protein DHS20C14_20630 [Phycisphaeraceae bacterium]|nr:MAG: hypothetical protein DHS20C14_20630 [Phycisphaeraceae bacterium]
MTRTTAIACAAGAAFTCLASHAAAQDFLLVSDATGDKIIRYEYETGAPIDHFVGKGISPLNNPIFLRVTPDGDIAAASRASDSIELYDGDTGKWLRTLVAPGTGGLNEPRDLVFDADGFIYVASAANNRVIKYTAEGAFDRNLITSGLQEPSGLAIGPDGLLYVSSRDNDLVRSYHTDTGDRAERLPIENTGIDGPTALAFGPDGSLYIAGRHSDSIIRVPAFGVPSVLVSNSPVLDGPSQFAFDADGDLLVVSQDTDTIVRFDAQTGAFAGSLLTPGLAGGLNDAVGIAFLTATAPDTPGCNGADIDANGVLNVDDIEAFVIEYTAGCP